MKSGNQSLVMAGLLLLLVLPLCSASLGTYKQNECVDIKTILNSTSVNISTLTYPNSTLALTNVEMTKIGQSFNYTFCDTSALGTYIYDYFDNSGNVYVNDFDITKGGETLTNASSLLYVIFVIISFILLIGFIMLGFSIEGSNQRDEEGFIQVNNYKYIKLGLFFMAYIVSIWFFFNCWTISDNFLYLPFMAGFFRAVFFFLTSALLPVFFGFVIFTIYWLFVDARFKKMFEQGIPALDG